MSVLPDPARSRAVLVGTSRYEHLEQLPAVSNNLQALADLLSSPLSLHLPPQHVTVIENPAAAHTVLREVRQAAAEATDTLIVYFAGHGLIDPQDTLSLALPHTEVGRVETGLPYDWVRQGLLQESRAERHVIILDCCYSGLALGRMSASPGLADQAVVEGSFLIAAAAETRTALAPVGDTYTLFTRALLDTLRHGIPGGPALLDLGAIYRHLRQTLEPRGHPVPQARDRNTGAQVALGRNHAVPRSSPENAPVGAAAARPLVDADSRPQSQGAPPPSTSTPTVDSRSGTSVDSHVPEPENTHRNGADVSTPVREAAVRSSRKGRHPRIALIGAACLALLASGYLVWDPFGYELTDSETIRAAREDGELKIGVKDNQPGLSDNTGTEDSPSWVGFDVDFGRNIGRKLGFEKDQIKFIEVNTVDREHRLTSTDVDIVVSSYSITDDREKKVDFAGPYFRTDQGMLVYTESFEGDIDEPQDLPEGTEVCTVGESISEDVMKKFPREKFDLNNVTSYQECIEALHVKEDINVMVTDRPILAGFLKENHLLSLVRTPIVGSVTNWGVGMRKGDPALRHFVCESIDEQIENGTWKELYEKHLKKVLDPENVHPSAPTEEVREEYCG
ncbi:transporter substrate-binding domain-containing protein [Streptomyces sp. LHD-70]|uniref:caspase, EACC1-associated type n=1 Tax=Streptomyces sp. LHD-70 TaxID=3072140 RepID=UPI00280EA2F2|nr:transporter substrate-binding domain-containing protein [Streptomyces sp. LHD-70]MDQ8707955.1 transporter substrate-binding domain-containing protein [Streptomyces sp. LHD-70]